MIPTYHKERVAMVNNLYAELKAEGRAMVEVVIITDNPELHNVYKGDVIVKLPKRIGFTRAVNIGEKFVSRPLFWWMDDSAMPEKGWVKKSIEEYWSAFPDGFGYLGFDSGETDHHNCCARGLTTKQTAYSLNGQNLLWPEYIHSGDAEFTQRCNKKGWFKRSTVKVHEERPHDETYKLVSSTFAFDREINDIRIKGNYPMTLIPDWLNILKNYKELNEIRENLLCQKPR
jgi:hypothetical protein